MANAPKITLYTNHRCPYAHRAHITLKELGLEYEEVIIDLDTPREPWYLEVNPRGLVPSIKYNGEILTESAIVAQFLADAHGPSSLLPASNSAEGALRRARINFFVDTWNTKAGGYWLKIASKETEEAREELAQEFVGVVAKEIEPLLHDAAPFFGGSSKLTFAEAITAPFIVRLYALARAALLPKSIVASLDKLPNFSKWAAAVTKEESVTYVFDEEHIVARMKARYLKSKA